MNDNILVFFILFLVFKYYIILFKILLTEIDTE